MARKKAKASGRAGWLTVAQAAQKQGVSAAAVRNWLKEERDLGKAVTKMGGVTFFPPVAMSILAKVQERRFKAAPRALQMAWAARRSGGHKAAPKARAVTARRAPAPKAKAVKRAPVASSGLSGVEAAKALGINKVKLYELLKKHGIRKSGGRRAFTPDIIGKVRAVLSTGKTVTRSVAKVGKSVPSQVRTIATAVGAAGDRAFSEALALVRSTAIEFRETVVKLFEQQRQLLEKALRPIRLKVDRED